MKNLKNTIGAAALLAVLAFSSTFAHAGIIVAGRDGDGFTTRTTEQICVEKIEKVDWGIIVAGLTGIIVAGLTGSVDTDRSGIIVAGVKSDVEVVNCGIIVAG